jgi:hypothetical protein
MAYILISLLLLFLLTIIVCLFSHSIIQLKHDWPLVKEAWSQMNVLEKNMFIIGFLIFLLIPSLKSHPSADWYITQVIIEILPALAGSFFVAGVISFLKQTHRIRDNSLRKW